MESERLTTPTNSQEGPEICSLCDGTDPLFESNGSNLEAVVRLSCLHTFHLKCIFTFLKNKPACPCCHRPIDLGDDNTEMLSPEEYKIEKLFKELTNRPQNFDPIMVNTGVETGNPTTPETVFVELHNKLVDAEKILEKKSCELSLAEYEVLDSYYSLGEALVKKLAEFSSNHPLQTARILLNAEIKKQFLSNNTHNVFNKKKRSAMNIYKIFSTEGLKRDDIKRIRRFQPSFFGRFTDKEMKIIQERIRKNSSRPNWLEYQLDDLDLNGEEESMVTD